MSIVPFKLMLDQTLTYISSLVYSEPSPVLVLLTMFLSSKCLPTALPPTIQGPVQRLLAKQ